MPHLIKFDYRGAGVSRIWNLSLAGPGIRQMHLGFLPLRSASALLVRRCSGLASDAAFVASAERVRVYAHLHRQHPAAKELTDLANTLELLQRRPADPTTIQIRTNVMASLSAILAQMHEPRARKEEVRRTLRSSVTAVRMERARRGGVRTVSCVSSGVAWRLPLRASTRRTAPALVARTR